MKYKLGSPNRDVRFSDSGQDIYQRSEFAKMLTNIIRESDESLVISLEASWGEGKTSFIFKWINELNDEVPNIPNIYVDAYSHDFQDDPFTVISYEIYKKIQESDIDAGAKSVLAKQFKKTISSVATGVTKSVIRTIARQLIGDSALTDLAQLVGGELEKNLTSSSPDVLENFEKRLTLLEDLTNNLKKVTKHICKDGPLIIFIDELDRCRPTFALDMIESVKHLFSVEKIIFVLINNPHQLNETVKSLYGQSIDSRSYLAKLYDLQFILPSEHEREDGDITTDLNLFIREKMNYIFGTHPLRDDFLESYTDNLSTFRTRSKLSLRDIEKLCTLIALFEVSGQRKELLYSKEPIAKQIFDLAVVSIAVLFIKDPNQVYELRTETATWGKIYPSLKLPQIVNDKESQEEEVNFWHYYLNEGDLDFYNANDTEVIIKVAKNFVINISRFFLNIKNI